MEEKLKHNHEEKVNGCSKCSEHHHEHEHEHGHSHDHHHEHDCCGHDHHHGKCCCGDDEALFESAYCSCCGEDEDEHSEKAKIISWIVGGAVFLASFFFQGKIRDALCVAAYVILGADVLLKAGKNIIKGKVFDENFLMSIATIGAILIGKYPEAVEVMLFYGVGEMLSDYAVERSEKSVNAIMNIRPDIAYIDEGGKRKKVLAKEISKGQIIEVLPGERIPLDGVIAEGESFLDLSCITGESKPERAETGKKVMSGAVNLSGRILVEVTEEYENSTASKIIAAMKNSLDKKAKSEKFITAFAKKYTPAVIAVALAVAFIVPLFDGFLFTKWIYRSLIFLVVSCPCALVISVPLGFFAGIGAASKKGVIIKGGNSLEKLAKTDAAVFDKTGTLTTGVFEVTQINAKLAEDEFLSLCAYAEHFSNHPIASAIKKACGEEINESLIESFEEVRGKGISVVIGGKKVLAGNKRLLEENGITAENPDCIGTVVHFALDGEYAGYLVVSDVIRNTKGLEKLKKMGYKTVMLTGDLKSIAEKTAEKIGIDEVHAELLPQDKVRITEEFSKNHSCVFVGDGINDAPVLAAADVGAAMGGIGSDAAVDAADIVLMNDDIEGLADTVSISRKTMGIVKQNVVLSIGVKVLVMLFSVLGIAAMWMAVVADVGVAVAAVINSMRILRVKK